MNAPTPMPPPPAAFPPPRVAPHAGHAFAGVWRLTTRRFFTPGYWLMLAGMLALLVLFSIPSSEDRADAARDYLEWSGGIYACFLVPVIAFLAGAGAMRDDLGAGTVDYVFTRPVARPAYVAFRYLAQMACTQIDFVFALGVVAVRGSLYDVPGLAEALPRVWATQCVAIVVFSAAGSLCALLTSRYVIVGILYGGIVELGLGNVPTQLNQISLVRHLLAMVRPLLGAEGWSVTVPGAVDTLGFAGHAGILVAAAVGLIAIAATLFAWREFAGAAGRDA